MQQALGIFNSRIVEIRRVGGKGGSRTLILTKNQENGLKIAVARYKNKEPYTCIAGYA